MSHNPRITPQFKQECVAFALKHANRTLLSIAKELNVSKSALSRWVRDHQHLDGGGDGLMAGQPAKRPLSEEQKTIAALEKEVHFLREVNDILKKATTYFATQSSEQAGKPASRRGTC